MRQLSGGSYTVTGVTEITDKPRSGRSVSAATKVNKDLMIRSSYSLCKTFLSTVASVEVLRVPLS